MQFLVDEDFPGIAVRWLREAGHDVLWARTSMPGQSDAAVLEAAQRESRVVLTCAATSAMACVSQTAPSAVINRRLYYNHKQTRVLTDKDLRRVRDASPIR